MTLSQAGYVVNDSLVKLTVEDIPLFEVIFVRGLFISALLLIAAAQMGLLRGFRRYVRPALLARVAAEMVATVFYLTALSNAPLAGLTAVMQVVPIAVTFVAARLLRERVSWHRVGSVIAGFLGVLIIVRPGSDGFNPWLLLGLLAVIAIVARELATTRVPSDTPSIIVSLCTGFAIMTMGGVGSVVQGWEPISGPNLIRLVAAACFLILGYIASVITVRIGELSFSAPFRYTVLVFAIILQIALFDEVPDALTFVGTALITAAGLYVFSRESRTARMIS